MSIEEVVFRTVYNYDRDAVSDDTGLKCDDPSLADQSQEPESNINVIFQRFRLTGLVPAHTKIPLDHDFAAIPTFEQAMNLVAQAKKAFMEYPADVRAVFDNDPVKMVSFVSDPDNKAKAIKMGLVLPDPVVDNPPKPDGPA